MIRGALVILCFIIILSEVDSQVPKESEHRIEINGISDSLAYLDAKENILIYDNKLNVIDTIYKRYSCSSETAQIKIIEFGTSFSLVDIQLRSICAYENNDSVFAKKCKVPLKKVKIKSKYLYTYIQYPIIYKSSDKESGVVLDLVKSADLIWPHIRDAQIVGIEPEWYMVKFKFKGKTYTGWVEASSCCPMTFSNCG